MNPAYEAAISQTLHQQQWDYRYRWEKPARPIRDHPIVRRADEHSPAARIIVEDWMAGFWRDFGCEPRPPQRGINIPTEYRIAWSNLCRRLERDRMADMETARIIGCSHQTVGAFRVDKYLRIG